MPRPLPNPSKAKAREFSHTDREQLRKKKISVVVLAGGKEYVLVDVDEITNSLRIIDTEHAEIHDGEHFFSGAFNTVALASDTTYLITTVGKDVQLLSSTQPEYQFAMLLAYFIYKYTDGNEIKVDYSDFLKFHSK